MRNLITIFVLLATFSFSNALYCGGYSCSSDYYLAYCCGFNDSLCCYSYIYQVWWFWIIWLILFLTILGCSCGYRRRRIRLMRQQAAMLTTPAVVTISSSGYPNTGYNPYPQQTTQYTPYPFQTQQQQQPQYPYTGSSNPQTSSPPTYSSVFKN